MLCLEIRLLTGRYAAATVTDPGAAEWPPHPARAYSALTAALHDDPEPRDDEIRAVKWLAGAGTPEIFASPASMREMRDVFVPTNDQKALPDIDPYIDRLTAAEMAFEQATGKDRAKAEKILVKATASLRARSIESSKDDGRGAPANAAELHNRRLKPQPRRFPVAIPSLDVVHFQWSAGPPAGVLQALDRVAARVSRLGHSSSLVAMRVHSEPADAAGRERWVPTEHGDTFIRVPLPDQLERLHAEHERHQQVEQRLLPAHPVRYSVVGDQQAAPEIPTSVFSDVESEWLIFEVVGPLEGGRRLLLDISLSQHLARAMRGTLLGHIDPETSPAVLTGHSEDGSPAELPHLAYVPLADVGHPHASGAILGLALIPPRDFGIRARDRLLEAIYGAEVNAAGQLRATSGTVHEPQPLRITLGKRGVVYLRRLRESSSRLALSPSRWTQPALRWYTATAVALGRNPGNLQSREPGVVARAMEAAERTIEADCLNIGLPRPSGVWVHRRSLLNGAPAARRFMPFPSQTTGLRRVCVHAEVHFDTPVRGPLILGAGRYFGLGLCAPVVRGR